MNRLFHLVANDALHISSIVHHNYTCFFYRILENPQDIAFMFRLQVYLVAAKILDLLSHFVQFQFLWRVLSLQKHFQGEHFLQMSPTCALSQWTIKVEIQAWINVSRQEGKRMTKLWEKRELEHVCTLTGTKTKWVEETYQSARYSSLNCYLSLYRLKKNQSKWNKRNTRGRDSPLPYTTYSYFHPLVFVFVTCQLYFMTNIKVTNMKKYRGTSASQ